MSKDKTAVQFKKEQVAYNKLQRLLKDAGVGTEPHPDSHRRQLVEKTTKDGIFTLELCLDYPDPTNIEDGPALWLNITSDENDATWSTVVSYQGEYRAEVGWFIMAIGPTSIEKSYHGPKPLTSKQAPTSARQLSEPPALKLAAKLVRFFLEH